MVVNDVPGEECRIAIVQENHLEELFSERTATATNVGNIYKGRVVNVEAAIQAAFVDYGKGQNGFLHISDLHPRYFPGRERTERVGKKIPRRDRPLMQEALRRGDEVLVQVLKEGLGTKGPTLTSYLSIPGRLLVAMPDMDRVGVSRKVEDEEKRREMRKILDSLDLPEGFGFILRTAGFDKNKTELKRDVAYLMRLWKAMEKRIKSTKGPCELYVESDLLIRTVRDVLRPSIKAIIVDSDSAYQRARSFLQVVAPRSAPMVVRYTRPAPIFHAFDIERQIELIHCREVPLPSGGRLVIDQTEALVAIDVNSGKSRAARDSETNAFQTNCEAVDEICRQLRLRDLGGLIINDLIDMRATRNRRQIEERFHADLKRDRARTTILRISDFGIVEMTRQRMRPSLRKSHFIPCQHCGGHGEIKSPESVGADTLRHIGFLLQFDRVRRVELVCSPRVASVLLSSKRRSLVNLEDATGRRVDVRVSDAIAADRVDYYAYDDRNADIDISQLEPPKIPSVKELEAEARKAEQAPAEEVAEAKKTAKPAPEADAVSGDETDKRGRGRRRRRGRKPIDEKVEAAKVEAGKAAEPSAPNVEEEELQEDASPPKKKSRRRRRRRRGGGAKAEAAMDQAKDAGNAKQAEEPVATDGAPLRIHELAKQLNVTSREVLDRCDGDPDVMVKNHMSTVPPTIAQRIRTWFKSDSVAEETLPASEKKPGATKRRRGGKKKRGGSGRSESAQPPDDAPRSDADSLDSAGPAEENTTGSNEGDGASRPSRKRRGRRSGSKSSTHPSNGSMSNETNQSEPKQDATGETGGESAPAAESQASDTPKTTRRRRLYRNRSRVSTVAREAAERAVDE